MRQTILFDLDDTLIHCNKYFNVVIQQFVDTMLTWFAGHGLTEEAIKQKQLDLDLAGVEVHGFKAEQFPQSFIETYHYYCDTFGIRARTENERWLSQLGHSVYAHSIEPYPNMEPTLQSLTEQGHELFLYTGGDATIQMRKVEEAGLNRYFGERIFVALHKTREFMETLIHTQDFERSRTWMIGNSVRTDVMPALESGIHAIYIPAQLEWKYNVVDITATPKGAFFTLPSLAEVPKIISDYTGQRAVNL
ncbi:HAD family hydrolase [Paenibacillus sp. FJAT-26967]|uniref:HAD family hydrolase n=1 Tax=Paenibacillus sp. FJAT-26967 TaxID=1729690 RepID=UPI0008385B32|nr:HAD family hydrolase [Paenibacillus sp. FJAT-26967]